MAFPRVAGVARFPSPAAVPAAPRADDTHRLALQLVDDILTFADTAPAAVETFGEYAAQIRMRQAHCATTVATARRLMAHSRQLVADQRAHVAELRQRIIGRVRRFDADDVTATDKFTAHLARRRRADR